MKKEICDKIASVIMAVLVFGISGCDELFDALDELGDESYYGDNSTEDELIVSGSGESIKIHFNNLTFPAQLNWEDGNYYFSPDPEGKTTGDKIVCVASITPGEVEGDCFRSGKVCIFFYVATYDDSDTSDAYYLSSSSCKMAADLGPFLVPIESPLCGQDPYPACPDLSDDMIKALLSPATEEVE